MAIGEGEEAGENDAARAFESLRAEIASLRRAVDRLATERTGDAHAPDYSETLGVISQNLSATAQRVDALTKSPALSLAPQEIGRQITAAGFDARREDHRLFVAAKQGMDEVAARLGRQLHSHTEAGEQRRRLWQVGLVGLVLGMVLCVAIADPTARAVPASWLWPERMAARSLDMPMWEGGKRLMQAGNPQAYAGVVAGNRLVIANRQTLEACRKRTGKAAKVVRCTIQMEADD